MLVWPWESDAERGEAEVPDGMGWATDLLASSHTTDLSIPASWKSIGVKTGSSLILSFGGSGGQGMAWR